MSQQQDTANNYERTFKIPDGIYHDNEQWWTWYQPTVAEAVSEAVANGIEPGTITVSLLDEDGEPMAATIYDEPTSLLVRVGPEVTR